MADYKLLIPFIKRWEGGFVNDPHDQGGATNMGVTIGTYRKFYGHHKTVDDLKAMTEAEWSYIFKSGYWDRWRADEIKSQPVANAVVDWLWHSGVHGIKIPQRLVGVPADGIVGLSTIAAVNRMDSRVLFDAIHDARIKFVEDIVKDKPLQEKFLKGWKNRINSLKY